MDIAFIPTGQRYDKQQRFLKDNNSFEIMAKAHHKLIEFIEVRKQLMETNMLSLDHIQNEFLIIRSEHTST